jgi:hypothetical protein
MLSTTIKRTIATTLSGAAIAGTIGAPAATAMPIDPLGTGDPGDTQVVAPTPSSNAPSVPAATPDVGFDLSSAAIGAAAGTGLLIVVLAAGGIAARRPFTGGHRAASV